MENIFMPEIAQPKHGRRLVLSGVSLTIARLNKNNPKAAQIVRDEIEQLIIENKYLEGAPFSWVGITIRYGLKYEEKPHYFRIDKKDGELPLAIEIDTHDIINVPLENLIKIFKRAILVCLVDAGKKYNRPYEVFEKMLLDIEK
jgi:hypothetical protein